MPQRRGNTLNVGIIVTAILATLLAGCGASSTTAAIRQPTATATAFAASTPTLEPTLPPKSQPCYDTLRADPTSIHLGDMVLSVAFANPDGNFDQLPDNTPLKPLKVAVQQPAGPVPDPAWPHSILTATKVYAYICNSSTTQTHTVTKIHMKISTFTPYTAQLNAWDFCSGVYAHPAGVTPSNCGQPGFSSDVALQSSFSTTTPGTVADATGNYPVSFPPNALHTIGVAFTVPATRGYYTFSLDAVSDVGTLPYSTATWPLLNAPIARMWGGPECNTATMLAQIPAGTDPYICPKP